MPFLAAKRIPIPTKDVLSWQFDEPQFDHDRAIFIDAKDPASCITANQAKSLIRRLVSGFEKAGLQKGDCVSITSFNNIYYPILVLGIIGAGGMFTGTNPSYTSSEISHHFKAASVKFAVASSDLLENIVNAKHKVETDRIYVFDDVDRIFGKSVFRSWKMLLHHGEEDWIRFDDLETSSNTTAMLKFSSGTTGLPKPVMLSHYNLVAHHTVVYERWPTSYQVKRLLPLPMFHAASAPLICVGALRSGDMDYIMTRYETNQFLDHIEKYEITDIMMMAPIVVSILGSPRDKRHLLRSIRLCWAAGAPLDKGPQQSLQSLLPKNTPFTQFWGMTEATTNAAMFPPSEFDDTGSVGYPVANLDFKVTSEDGSDVSHIANVRGELCIRGPTVTRGYFENPEANARDWDADGFLKTGDVASVDSQTGKWYIVDRKKELIKVRGFQVAPAEIEGALLQHPHIVEAAVIGIFNHSTQSEAPRAYIVRDNTPEAQGLSRNQVQEFIKMKLAKYKWLEGGVRFVDAIPKGGSGKMLKKILREWADDQRKLESMLLSSRANL